MNEGRKSGVWSEKACQLLPEKSLITTTTPRKEEDGSTELWSASLQGVGVSANRREAAGAVFVPDGKMTAEEAFGHLRRKIALQIHGGSHGLMRCWILFRNRAGSTKDGITYQEFCHGLRAYGLPLPESVSLAMFKKMDAKETGQIHIREFIDNVMGRWSATTNTLKADNNPLSGGMIRVQKRHQQLMVDDRPDPDLSKEDALNQLRLAISQRLRSGPHGLLRCWIDFRQRAGSSKAGITRTEFARGVRAYNVPLHPKLIDEIHKQMDVSGDGHIQINEFIDNVMGRNVSATIEGVGEHSNSDLDENNCVSSKLQAKQRLEKQNMINEAPDESLEIEDALRMLRKYITQRLKSGPNGLMRCWFEFRLRAGSSKDGISRSEFARGLRLYGIPLTVDKTTAFFNSMDLDKDGHIQIHEFIDVIMGRWNAATNSGGIDKNATQDEHQSQKVLSPKNIQNEPCLDICADEALRLLRAKIAQRLKGGSHGLQRAWKAFRCAGGGDHDGVTAKGFERALKVFQLPLKRHVIDQLFSRFQLTNHNKIDEHTFITIIMGRANYNISEQDQSDTPTPLSIVPTAKTTLPAECLQKALPFSPISTSVQFDKKLNDDMPSIQEDKHVTIQPKHEPRKFSSRYKRPATSFKKPRQLQSVPFDRRPSSARILALHKAASAIQAADARNSHEFNTVKKFCA